MKRRYVKNTKPKKDLELVCICKDFLGVDGPGISVTVAKADGLSRRVILHDGSILGMVGALKKAAQWLASGAQKVDGVKPL